MATEEEVRIVINTVGNVAGAQQVAQSLQQVQNTAQQTQNAISQGAVQTSTRVTQAIQQATQLQQLTRQAGTAVTNQQQTANAALASMLQQLGPTIQNYQTAVQRIQQGFGTRPTLPPQAFGIQPPPTPPPQPQPPARPAAAAQPPQPPAPPGGPPRPPTPPQPSQQPAAQQQLRLPPAVEIARFTGAALGIGFGLSAYAAAGRLVGTVISQIVERTLDMNRALVANTLTLGQSAAGFQDWAKTVSQAAGVTETSLLQAGTAAQLLSRQAALGPDAAINLTQMAVALHDIQGIDVAQAMNQLSAAIQGNQQAAAGLNLQLDAGYVAFTQLGGASADVFNSLDKGTQATLRYAAAQEQLNRNIRNAPAGPVRELNAAQSALNAEWEKFTTTLGPGAIEALAGLAAGNNGLLSTYNRLTEESTRFYEQTRNTNSLQAELGRLGTVLSQSFHPQVTAAGAGGIFSELGREARDFADQLPQMLAGLPGQIGSIFEQIGTTVSGFLHQRIDIDVGPLQAAAAQARELLGQIGQQVAGLAQQITRSGLGQSLAAMFDQIGNAAAGLIDQLGQSGLGQAIQNLVGPAMKQANEQFSTYTDQLIATAGRLQEQLLATLEKTRAQIDAVFSDIAKKAQDYADQLSKTGLGQAIGAGADNARRNLQGAAEEAQNFFDSAKTEAQGYAQQTAQAFGYVAQATTVAVGQATQATGQFFDDLGQGAQNALKQVQTVVQASNTANGALIAKLQDVREARARPGEIRTQLADAGAFRALDAARQNEIRAAQELDNLRQQGLDLTSQEAQIRLSMLPTQERMVELQNQANQAQIEATQRSLPAQRALEDLQNDIARNRLIAESGNQPIAARQAALRTAAVETRQLPDVERAALEARINALPAQRAAQDVGLEAQRFNLQQQQAVQGLEYSRQQLGFLQQIAEAVGAQAVRAATQLSTVINVALTTGTMPLTDDDIKNITTVTMDAFGAALKQGATQVNSRSSTQLLGAGATP